MKTRYLNLTKRKQIRLLLRVRFLGNLRDIFLSEEHWHICQPVGDSQHLIPSDLE